MIYFKLKAEDVIKYNSSEEAKKRIKEILDWFDKADKELERVCKELGIDKPEMICSDGVNRIE